MSLELRSMTVRYRQPGNDAEHVLLALDNIDLELRKGHITALVGESGCGKTTLAKAFMGLLPDNALQQGAVVLDGLPLPLSDEKAMNAFRWRRISMVFQNGGAGLHPLYTIRRQIAEPLQRHLSLSAKEADDQVVRLITEAGLPSHLADRYPHELSGGQLQRCFLAMALALDPDYLLLDEPTAALDPGTRTFILNRLKVLRNHGKGILLITHDLGGTANLADETRVMYLGSIVEEFSGSLLTHEVRHPYSRGLLRSFPGMNATRDLSGLRGEPIYRIIHTHATGSESEHQHSAPHEHAPSEGCLFRPRCTQAAAICASGHISLEGSPGNRLRCARGGIVPLLELSDITCTYDSHFTLGPVQLRIMAGETFCLIGETGSGKSTLAKILVGMIPPEKGSLLMDEQPVQFVSKRRELAKKIGFVAQNPLTAVSPRLTVMDIVAEPLRIQQPDLSLSHIRQRVIRILKEVRLPETADFLTRHAHELNTGALQRICLARALINDPVLLVADEPTSALDPSVQAKILRTLMELQTERGLTLFFVTHDFGVARKIADRIGVMQNGKLIEVGTTRQILEHPTHVHTRFLLDCARGEQQGE